MDKRISIGILAIILTAVIFISGCVQKTEYVCPDGSTVSDPSLCPPETEPEAEPEPEPEPVVSNEISEAEFEIFAERFGRKLIEEDFEELYHLLTPTRRRMISKEKFIDLYPKIYNTGIYSSMILTKTTIDKDEAFAYYDVVYRTSGFKESTGPWYFKKEQNTLGFDGFTYLVYAGCYETSDCYEGARESVLNGICKDTCEEETGFLLKEGEEYKCNFNICECNCYDSERDISYYRKINLRTFH